MITCTRRIYFDAAHRVMEHESVCRMLHGHRYTVEAAFSGEALDSLGRVIDFGRIKDILGDWINTHWDHNTLLWEKDIELGKKIHSITEQTIYYLPYNPTAENLALYLFETICPDLFKEHNVNCTHVRIYETPNCYADVQ